MSVLPIGGPRFTHPYAANQLLAKSEAAKFTQEPTSVPSPPSSQPTGEGRVIDATHLGEEYGAAMLGNFFPSESIDPAELQRMEDALSALSDRSISDPQNPLAQHSIEHAGIFRESPGLEQLIGLTDHQDVGHEASPAAPGPMQHYAEWARIREEQINMGIGIPLGAIEAAYGAHRVGEATPAMSENEESKAAGGIDGGGVGQDSDERQREKQRAKVGQFFRDLLGLD